MSAHYRKMWSALLLMIQLSHGFVTHTKHHTATRHRIDLLRIDAAATADNTESDAGGIQMVSLKSLGDDHEAVGESMANSLAAWLDDEWMPQEVHIRMGASVKRTYVTCRTNGVDDIATIMTDVTDDLYAKWAEYNADAFVNAWDCGNYVADYLIAKSGGETAACSTKIADYE